MNSQGNFQENSDFKAQQASDEVSNTETPDSGTKEQNQVAQSWEEQKTIIPEDIAENPLAISEDEIYDLSVANIVETEADSENLELGDFGLLDFSVDNTQDLLPFVDDDLENATDESDLEELIFDEEELSLEPPDNLDDLFAEEAIAVKEMNLDSLDTEWETHTIDIGNDDRDLGLGNFADETSLELNELSMADDLELDRLSDESSLELDEPLIEHDLELSNFANETSLELDELSMADDLELDRLSDESSLELDEPSMADDLELDRLSDESSLELDEFSMADDLELDRLSDESSLELDEFSMADDLELDRLLDESTASDSLDDLDLELDDSLESLKELGGLDNLLNNSQKLAISAPALVEIRTPLKESSSPAPAKANTFDQTMRVSVRKLDNLNNLIGELVVKRNRLEEDQKRIRRFMDNLLSHVQSLGDMGSKMHDLYERSLLEGALIASRQQSQSSSSKSRSSFLEEGEEEPQNDNELDALELDRFTGFHLLSQDIIELIVRVREAASDIQFVVDETDKVTQSLRQATSQLQDGMNSSRMIPFGQTTDRLPRAIRDISRQLHKQVELQVEGKDVLIDKMIVENLYNPMTHLVNNAITHGIESPEKRIKSGKSVTGTLSIRAFLQGNQTVIAIADDGAGIDPERVKAKAVEKNLLTWAQAQNLSKQEVYDLIFHPGFSTQDQADDFAGRGVGMDVVSTDLKKIRGTIGIESKVGKGTIFTIRLPLVLSICKAISCVFNNTRIAFPLDGVEAQKEFAPSEIQTNENGVKQIPWNNTLLPFQPLSNLLSYNRQIKRGGVYNLNKDDDTISVIVLRSADNLLAVEVDQIIGEQEIVIKQIEGPAPKPAGIAGATVLGDGIIMPIADVLELIEIAQGKRTIELGFNIWQDKQDQQKQEAVHTEPTVLVVDDSITVRELLTLSFNKLGYRVEQAKDGQEGWDKLRGGLPCDMIFCDIEMPRMNGLELLSNLQKEDNLKRIPVAMLTSRGADKHRQLATDLGAKAYLTKPYTEKDLMDVAQKLIEINRVNREAELMVVNSNTQFDDDGDNSVTIKPKSESLVLIIDDSVTVRELLSMTFKKAGYQVEKARDGQEAWEKLRDGLECDIAFCDIEMPRMNGLELLSNLQQHEVLSSLPIAMLTSRGAQKMRNIAAQRGARGYFVKPYVEETLLDAAEKMMKGEVLIEQTDLGDSN